MIILEWNLYISLDRDEKCINCIVFIERCTPNSNKISFLTVFLRTKSSWLSTAPLKFVHLLNAFIHHCISYFYSLICHLQVQEALCNRSLLQSLRESKNQKSGPRIFFLKTIFRKIISESGTETENLKSETTTIISIFLFSGFVEKCQRTNFPDKKASHARPNLG